MASFDITIELTPDDIKLAITRYVSEEFPNNGMTLNNEIKFNFERSLEGYGPGEHNVTTFTGASVKLKKLGPYQDR